MRQLIQGVLIPGGLLAYVIYVRGENEGTKRWHPWQLTWDLWLASVVITSMMVGAGLYAYWRRGGWRTDTKARRRFDHDAVQLDADESNGPARDAAMVDLFRHNPAEYFRQARRQPND